MAIPEFADLMDDDDPSPGNPVRVLQMAGILIDLAHDQPNPELREAGTARALGWLASLDTVELTSGQKIEQLFFIANAWENRRPAQSLADAVWQWHQPAIKKQIFYLRLAVGHPDFEAAGTFRQCEILTNLAGQLDWLGRFVEALELWNRALALRPDFVMALGNRGIGRVSCAKIYYASQTRERYVWEAHADLKRAVELGIERSYPDQHAVAYFAAKLRELEAHTHPDFLAHPAKPIEYPLGETGEERSYRSWVLDNCLFLDPLNDLGRFTTAADQLLLPAIRTNLNQASPPPVFGLFNQLKQEYVSARYVFFEGLRSSGPHFSDRDVLLTNTLDYPTYGLSTEKVKLAFRSLYSLFDKVAFFLNLYLDLGVSADKVSFRTIWWSKMPLPQFAGVLRKPFVDMPNLPFRGLYWLSKDFFERGAQEVMAPDASDLKDERDHLEHGFYHVTEGWAGRERGAVAHVLSIEELRIKTLRLMKLARAALIYLVCGIHIHERQRAKDDDVGLVMPMLVDFFEDEWKS